MLDLGLIEPGPLGRLMPMCLRVDAGGTIVAIGPTLAKVAGPAALIGASFQAQFCVKRPRKVDTIAQLAGGDGKVQLALHAAPDQLLRGVAVPCDDGGVLINLSFGIGLGEAVARHNLRLGDFAPTDLAIEMLYLQEANAAVTGELHNLTHRLEAARMAAEDRSFTDPLTGLRNRRALDQALDMLVAAGRPFALFHLDLDYFKAVNDSLGHAAGDYVLQQVARLLRDETRQTDTIARVGGDEFVVVLDNLTDKARLAAIGERLIQAIEKPLKFDNHECRISGSIGVIRSTDMPLPTPEALMAAADAALYASKDAGRGCLRFADKAHFS